MQLLRLAGNIASGFVLYFERTTKHARIGVGTFSMKCIGSDAVSVQESAWHLSSGASDYYKN